jgi:protein phosphatase
MLSLRAAALTDIGRVRRKNEDRYLLSQESMLYGVADGVGGLPNGAEAAQATVDSITAAVQGAAPGAEIDLTAVVHEANVAVLALGREVSPTIGIGTTLTFGVVREGALRIAHVGDSRCYVWRDGEFSRVTEDHSVENEARLRRSRGEVVYYHEANRNALTRCIGQPTPPDVDLIIRPLVVGERYLFCTDGVTRLVRDAELADLLAKDGEPEELLREIITLAVRRGGPDNATGVLVFVDEV